MHKTRIGLTRLLGSLSINRGMIEGEDVVVGFGTILGLGSRVLYTGAKAELAFRGWQPKHDHPVRLSFDPPVGTKAEVNLGVGSNFSVDTSHIAGRLTWTCYC